MNRAKVRFYDSSSIHVFSGDVGTMQINKQISICFPLWRSFPRVCHSFPAKLYQVSLRNFTRCTIDTFTSILFLHFCTLLYYSFLYLIIFGCAAVSSTTRWASASSTGIRGPSAGVRAHGPAVAGGRALRPRSRRLFLRAAPSLQSSPTPQRNGSSR